MKWKDTIARHCRYGDVAERIFGEAEIIWEHSENDYQGSANILAAMPDGKFIHYEWTYGSCSGCDEWEARDLNYDQIETEMRNTMTVLSNKTALKKYIHLEGKYKNAKVPTAQSPTAGSIPGMLRWMGGSIRSEFKEMCFAAEKWLENSCKK